MKMTFLALGFGLSLSASANSFPRGSYACTDSAGASFAVELKDRSDAQSERVEITGLERVTSSLFPNQEVFQIPALQWTAGTQVHLYKAVVHGPELFLKLDSGQTLSEIVFSFDRETLKLDHLATDDSGIIAQETFFCQK